MTSGASRPNPRSGEFFAPLTLAALALMVVNDVWLKPAFHSAMTGKLSDVAVCFVMPLFLSELLGLAFSVRPVVRLWIGAIVTGAVYAAQEVVPPFTRFALDALRAIGPVIGIKGRFVLTSDWTDLFCLAVIPFAFAYGSRRLSQQSASTGDRLG